MPHYGTTNLDPRLVLEASDALRLFCQLHLPGLCITRAVDDAGTVSGVLVYTADSLAEVPFAPVEDGLWAVIQRGTHRAWDSIETAVRTFQQLGQPGIERLGVTALDDPQRQYVWLDDPDGRYSCRCRSRKSGQCVASTASSETSNSPSRAPSRNAAHSAAV